MPVEVSYLEEGQIVVVHFQSEHTIQDYIGVIDSQLIPYVVQKAPDLIHVLWDWRELEWSFPDLMLYISSTVERRKNNPPPTNVQHHFIGAKPWINTWRTYMMKNYNLKTTAFKDIDQALLYIRAFH